MKKRTLLAALLVVPMGIALAQKPSILQTLEVAKTEAKRELEATRDALGEILMAAPSAEADLQPKYKAVADMAKGALGSIEVAISKTADTVALQKAAEHSKKATEAVKDIVVAIRANNVAQAASKAANVGEAIAQAAGVVQAGAAKTAAAAVQEAAADIKASIPR